MELICCSYRNVMWVWFKFFFCAENWLHLLCPPQSRLVGAPALGWSGMLVAGISHLTPSCQQDFPVQPWAGRRRKSCLFRQSSCQGKGQEKQGTELRVGQFALTGGQRGPREDFLLLQTRSIQPHINPSLWQTSWMKQSCWVRKGPIEKPV